MLEEKLPPKTAREELPNEMPVINIGAPEIGMEEITIGEAALFEDDLETTRAMSEKMQKFIGKASRVKLDDLRDRMSSGISLSELEKALGDLDLSGIKDGGEVEKYVSINALASFCVIPNSGLIRNGPAPYNKPKLTILAVLLIEGCTSSKETLKTSAAVLV